MLQTADRQGPWLTVVSGPMFAGKSEFLIALYRNLTEGRGRESEYIGVYKHALDKRYGEGEIVSHAGKRLPATPVGSAEELYTRIRSRGERVVLVDEGQFFLDADSDGRYVLVRVVSHLLGRGVWVVVAGLDKDFRGFPFGPMADLLALADERISLFARCAVCGAPATLTQRLVDGKPARVDDPLLLVGAEEAYEPRCRRCHRVEGDPQDARTTLFGFRAPDVSNPLTSG
ncbi:MAG: Thymidine kinase [Brockia lithotrophica]|uniref:Thymidine kinase n=1 Tax=Brockia lithotrophica TaxID=933949 RepID=A0A2T5G6G0_9BACL|nr:thymidine kinase [Brockia lithotrophica]PTQ51770.1 MAG: Thymidine kinase [Brockia lithotrophica]